MPDLAVTITLRGNGIPNHPQAAANMSLLIDTLIAFAAVNFPAFQRFAVDLSQQPPAQADVAAWFAAMGPGFLPWLMGAQL